MSELSPKDCSPENASVADIEILSYELYVAARRVFGDVFPRIPGQYQKTMTLDGSEDIAADIPQEFEMAVDVEAKKIGAMSVTRYGLAIISFATSNYNGYKTAVAQEFAINPKSYKVCSDIKTYLYSRDSANPAVITPIDDFSGVSFPTTEQPKNRPKYNKIVKNTEGRLANYELEFIYSCLYRTGCYDRKRGAT